MCLLRLSVRPSVRLSVCLKPKFDDDADNAYDTKQYENKEEWDTSIL